MEALIAILIEAILAPLFALFGAIASLLAGALSSFVVLIFNVVTNLLAPKDRYRPQSTAAASTGANLTPSGAGATHAPEFVRPPGRRGRPRWIRWLTVAVLSLTGLLVTALVVTNVWFLDDVGRYLLRQQQQRTGIVITAEQISGNLFTGRFRAEGIAVQRLNHPAGLIDLTIARVDTQIAVWRVLANPRVVESLTVSQMHGRFERGIAGIEPPQKSSSFGGVEITVGDGAITIDRNDKQRKRRSFRIDALSVRDLDITYVDHLRQPALVVPITLATLTVAPLRSQWAVFDVLFRSNAIGTVAGRPLTIATSGDELGRETQWHIDALPVAVLAAQIGGPCALLTAGTADVHVVDRWRRSDAERFIVMDWSVVLHDVRAALPEAPSPLLALLGGPAVRFINEQSGSIPLSFQVVIDENRFEGAASAEAAGLWQGVADSLAATLGQMLGIKPKAIKSAGGTALDAAKGVLERWRQKR